MAFVESTGPSEGLSRMQQMHEKQLEKLQAANEEENKKQAQTEQLEDFRGASNGAQNQIDATA